MEGGQWSRVLSAGRDRVLVAEAGEAGIVGFGSCGKARAGALGFEGEVYTLYVLPDHQGRGSAGFCSRRCSSNCDRMVTVRH